MMETVSPQIFSLQKTRIATVLRDLNPPREWRLPGIIAVVAVVAVNLWTWGLLRNDVLAAANAIPDGGGYCDLADSGVLETIKHQGSVILPASEGGSYCCGFTFEVAMKVAQERGLLAGKSVAQVRKFQRQWYGSEEGSEWRQVALAVEELGIGREIDFEDTQPGDFVAYHRTGGIGHSVVFLGWIKSSDGEIIGLRYRSSQPNTDGVADTNEFFSDSDIGKASAGIMREHFYVARLDRRWWSHLLYPLSS